MAGARTVREEHERFLPYLDALREVADSVGEAPPDRLFERTGVLHEFLAHDLMPHAVAEGQVLFPALRSGAKTAQTIAMTQCHRQLARLTDELEVIRPRLTGPSLEPRLAGELRRILYGIHVLLTTHFAESEEVFAEAVAARLSPEDRGALFARLDRCAEEVARLLESGG